MWPVDGATIRIMTDWDGRPDSPRYAQVTGLYGADGQIVLNDDELSYIRLNPRTHTPFGLGRVEVAFETINAFLSAYRYAGRLASNSVVQYALWLQGLTPTHHERLIRWWQDEIEGTGRVPIISAESKPEVLRFAAGTDADLRLAWQEFLVRIIADAFDLPAQFLGVERDVNRSTAAEMSEHGVPVGDCSDGASGGRVSDAGCDREKAGVDGPGICIHRRRCARRDGAGADRRDPAAQWSGHGERSKAGARIGRNYLIAGTQVAESRQVLRT